MAQQISAISRIISALLSRKGFVGLMVVASLGLSVASFYTTFAGMTQYMSVPWVTALITFGLQGTMFAMAWIISSMLGTGLRNIILMLFTFLLCAFVSIFFSFASLFGEIYTEEMRDQVNSGYVRSFYQDAVVELDTQLAERASARHRSLISSPEFQTWRTDVTEVVTVARNAPEVLRSRSERIQQNLSISIQTQEARIASITAQIGVLNPGQNADEERISRLKADIERAEQQLSAMSRQQGELAGEIAIIETEMEAELTGVGTVAGRGPKYRRLENERDLKIREKIGVDVQVERLEALIPDFNNQKAQLEGGIVNVAAENARLSAQLEAAQSTLERDRADLEEAQAVAGEGMLAQVDLLQRNLDRTQRGPEGLGEAIGLVLKTCAEIYDELVNDVELKDRLESVSCNAATFQNQVNDVVGLAARLGNFRLNCQPGSEITGEGAGDLFDNSVRKVEDCLSQSALPASATRSDLTALIASRGPDAHPFVTAQNALFEDRLPLSYMAGLLAFIIDCLILLAALLANFVGKSRREKALRALLHVNFDENGAAFVEVPRNHSMLKTIEEEATQMQLAGHGRYLRGIGGEPGKLELFGSAQAYLQLEIARETGDFGSMNVSNAQSHAVVPQRGF